jgi:hypothetical protein
VKDYRGGARIPVPKMMLAATICTLGGLAAIVNIEAWRRRTVAQIRLESRRQAARERAWHAMSAISGD